MVGSRFLQVDPVEGGSCNDYDYVCADPINNRDLGGTACTGRKCRGATKQSGSTSAIGGNPVEKEWCGRSDDNLYYCARAATLAEQAIWMTRAAYGGIGGVGKANAYQHVVWAMLLQHELGITQARGFLGRHERGAFLQPPDELMMDTYNNEVGLIAGGVLGGLGHRGDLAAIDATARWLVESGTTVTLPR